MTNIGAFFDIDGTLTRTSMMVEHFERMIQNEVIDDEIYTNEIKPIYEDYKRRYTEYDKYLEVTANAYNEALAGIPYDFVDFFANKVIAEKSDIVYRFTRSKIEYHLENGHKVFFISGSPEFLVKRMAEKYGVTDFKGTEFEVSDSKFTGKYKPMWDAVDKKRVMLEFKEKYDLDFSKSFAYGDTTGDISMLEMVGNPTAINPAKTLLQYIQNNENLREKINIIVERKDVIYSIPSDVKLV